MLARTRVRPASKLGLELAARSPCEVALVFNNARSEWAALWDASKNEWRKHSDASWPIGSYIIEAFVKPSHTSLLFSFAGQHELGFSRWGFSARQVSVLVGE
jgi:hypothetical protein